MGYTASDLLFMAQKKQLKALEAECNRREKDSFVFEGKKVRATAKDYLALAEFAHLISAGEVSWKPTRAWINGPPYDIVPLPTAADAARFKLAMLEHKEGYFVARSMLKAQIHALPSLEATEAFDVTSDAHWPVLS